MLQRSMRGWEWAARLDGWVGAADWFLSASGRGNDATELDRRRDDGLAWSTGNSVTPLIHGQAYWGVPRFLDRFSRLRGSVYVRAASTVQPAVQG